MWGQNAHVIQTLYICIQVCVCVLCCFFTNLNLILGKLQRGYAGLEFLAPNISKLYEGENAHYYSNFIFAYTCVCVCVCFSFFKLYS